MVGLAAKLEGAIANGSFSVVPPLPRATLQRVLRGARESPELSPSKMVLLPPA